MSTLTAASIRPTPTQIAQATAGAIPAELSRRPLLGIIAVLMGAGIVTLTSRMISLGLADLKGHMGFSFDDGACVGTAFDVGLMFIGPFTVYLGALIGPRRILLTAATAFMLTCLALPLVHSYSLALTLTVLAGLTSGTFYPLTLTFALRNIPIRFLPFTLALYATFVDGAVNIAPSLYGWYRDHLNWHWMFWNSAAITPLMMLCAYFGIPKTGPAKMPGAKPSFAGFLYASAGLAMILAACEQGERLDWWRSGIFEALFAGGAFLLACALLRRLKSPNPLVDMPYLRQWNTILLGICLFIFRFCLVTTIILVPQSLAVHGFGVAQIGPAVFWSAVPLLAVTFIAGMMLRSNIDTRLLLACGFAGMAIASFLNAELSSAWAAENYYRTELLMGVGQSFAFIGLVASVVMQGIFSGGLSRPPWILTFSAFFHTVRLFGGNIGAIIMGHFIATQEKLHSNLLGLHVQNGNWLTQANVSRMTAGLSPHSSGVEAATARSVGLLGSRLRLQAFELSIIDSSYLVIWACVVALVLVALLRESPLLYGDLSEVQQQVTEHREAKP